MRESFFYFNPNKSKEDIKNANTIHDKQIEEMRDILDNIDFSPKLMKGADEIYFYLDDILPDSNYIAKTLREVAKSDCVEINYDDIKINLKTEQFENTMKTLKLDCDEYLKVKDQLHQIKIDDEMLA